MAAIQLPITAANTQGFGGISITIFPQTVNVTTGTLTDGTGATFAGLIDESGINFELMNELENIRPMDRLPVNKVVIGQDYQITLTEILFIGRSKTLNLIFTSSQYLRIVLVRGDRTIGAYGIIERYSENLVRGKCSGSLVLGSIDPGVANPTMT